MKNQTRIDRLRRLRAVVELHKGQRGKPVKLNGVERAWNMYQWDCGTSACALGNYALTPYGKRHFQVLKDAIVHRETGDEYNDGAAEHFGISQDESIYLFMPSAYIGFGAEEEKPIAPTTVITHIDKIIRRYERGEGDMQEAEAT